MKATEARKLTLGNIAVREAPNEYNIKKDLQQIEKAIKDAVRLCRFSIRAYLKFCFNDGDRTAIENDLTRRGYKVKRGSIHRGMWNFYVEWKP